MPRTPRQPPGFHEAAVRSGAQIHINLLSKNWSNQKIRASVAKQFMEQFGKALGMSSQREMEKFLYERSHGRLRFQSFFEGKSKAEIMKNMERLIQWNIRQRAAASATIKRLNQDPSFGFRNAKRVIAAHAAKLRTDPQYAAAHRQRSTRDLIAYNKSKKGRSNSRRNMKKNWADPTFRKKVMDMIQSPEFREARREKSRSNWNDPDYLAKHAYRGGMNLLRALVANRTNVRPIHYKGVGDIKLRELMAITTDSSADQATAHEQFTRLVDEIGRLPYIERDPIVQTFFLGRTIKQIARNSKKPAPIIRERMRRGLVLLRSRLERNVA